ncbi:hypothetical protein MFIFM68171_07292 [Madurella fahalii]|uniref:Uncharacterized protein n=1 Tax=Madurella fahalii TaxID=1157608 RepID=A0ABQ0GH63_9PEZI
MSITIQGSPFTPEQLQYWLTHESDTLVPDIITCAVITGFFSTLFVIARILGRWWQRDALRVDISDWLLLVA